MFTKTNSSRLIYDSLKALKIKTSMIFNLVFANNTILLCFFFFFLIIDLHFLIFAVIAQSFNPTAELLMPIEISAKESKSEIETHPVTAEAKISKCSI